jgi:hypothetical protein
MISKPTIAHKCMKIYHTHRIPMGIFREVRYKGEINRNITEVLEPMRRYKI